MTTRKEERYLLSMSAVEQFREKIQPITSRKEVLTDFNHTVYFQSTKFLLRFLSRQEGMISNPFTAFLGWMKSGFLKSKKMYSLKILG